jgi:hypothetical protein
MSALGQKQISEGVQAMSALPPKADIAQRCWDEELKIIKGAGHASLHAINARSSDSTTPQALAADAPHALVGDAGSC